MPRSIQEIIDDAERLAAMAGDFEPSDEQLAYSSELARLYRAVRAHAIAQTEMVDSIVAARTAGAPWQAIGNLVGTSGEAARVRFGPFI